MHYTIAFESDVICSIYNEMTFSIPKNRKSTIIIAEYLSII